MSGLSKTSTKPDLDASFTPDTRSSLNSKPGSQKFALKSNQPTLTCFVFKSIDFMPFLSIFFFDIFSINPLESINILTFDL